MATSGTSGNDTIVDMTGVSEKINAGAGADYVDGGGGNDQISGGGGDDILDGGSGNDIVRGDGGDDIGTWNYAENAANTDYDYYDGGGNNDTLRLEFTLAEWELPTVQSEMARLLNFMATHAGPLSDGHLFTIQFDGGTRLDIRNWENLEIYIGGVLTNPRRPIVDLNGAGTPGSGNETIFTEDGGGIPIAPAAAIFDVDSANLTSMTVTLTNKPDGSDESLSLNAAATTAAAGLTVSYDATTGELTITGSATKATYEAILQGVVYNNLDQDPDDADRSISVVVSDGALTSLAATGTVNVVAVNDAPELDLDGSAGGTGYATTFTENGSAVPVVDADVSITDVDDSNIESATVILTNAQAGDSLAVAGVLPAGISVDPTSTTTQIILTGSASLADYEAALQLVVFSNSSENPDTTDREVEVVVNDGDDNSSTATTTITVVAVNDAPVLDTTKTPAGNAVLEDAGAPVGAVGTLISSLVDFASPSGQVDNVADVDAGALLGIAVTAADSTNGTWFYSIDGGTTWLALGAVSNPAALLLAPGARLYFQPNADYDGQAEITFRAWDQSSGSNGGTADTTANGGTTAFSTATDTAIFDVTPVNDAPVSTIDSVTTPEDTTVILTLDDFGSYSDAADGAAATALAAVKITTLESDGSLEWFDGLNWLAVTLNQEISAADIAGGKLRFVPDNNENGSPYATIGFRVSDGTDFSLAAYTLTVNVTADIAGVVIGPTSLQYDPDLSGDETPFSRFMFADADTTGSVTVTITRTVGDGTFSVSGTPVGGTAVVSGTGAALNSIVTLTGTIAAINAYIAANNITLDGQGNDADTYTISLASGASITNFVVSQVDFLSTGGTNTNNWAGINVLEDTLNSGNGSDVTYTSWSHVGTGATSYVGGTADTDTIYLNFTAGQLQDVLSVVGTRDDLQGFLSAPTGDTLSLGTTSWRATATDFEIANIELANEWSTRDTATPANNYIDINTNWKSVLTSVEIENADGGAGNDLIIATTAASSRQGLGGNDVLVASDLGNTLNGGSGLDLLLGGDGADVLIGGLGTDVLAGGAGADTFKWGASAGTEAPGVANADKIADYDFTEGDKLDLSDLLDANFDPGDPISQFVSVTQVGNDILVSVDANGTGSFGGGLAYTLIGIGTASANDPVRVTFEGQDHVVTV